MLTPPKYLLPGGVLALFVLLYVLTDGLTQPIYNDERHFWPTSILFADTGWPTYKLLFSYGELSTPLPFILFGWADNVFHQGIWSGRLINLLSGCALLLLFLYTGRQRPLVAVLAIIGILINPYFYVTTLYMYTDCVPIVLVLVGIYTYTRRWHWLSAVAFGLAICGRQYLVAFPAGILIWEGLQFAQKIYATPTLSVWRGVSSLAAYTLACTVLLAWRLFWGDWGPPGEVARQHVPTQHWHVGFGLYGLACLAVYHVLPAELLNSVFRSRALPDRLSGRFLTVMALLVILLCSCIIIKPGPQQIPYFLGPFERLLNTALGTGPASTYGKQAVYAALIIVSLRRYCSFSLPGLWLLLHVLIWSKAHVGWDKYTYPLVIVYWYISVLPTSGGLLQSVFNNSMPTNTRRVKTSGLTLSKEEVKVY